MISEVLQVHYFGSIGNAMYNAGSLECYLKVTKFSVSRISPLVKVEFRKSINLISLMLTDSTDRFQLDQFTLESILFTIYQISNQIFPLISGGVVQVNIPKQSGRKNFTQLFLCDISFNEENKYEIAFDNHALSSKNIFSENYGSVDNAQEKLTEVRKYIHENLDNPKISLGFIANLMGVSTKTLQRKLSKNDFTYRTLLLEEQMKAAEKLLVSTDLPIKHVSYEVGYSTPGSFCRSFKAFYGVTPSEFRGNLRLL
jgi:AraC-like DNA-binding protein